jgi:hypothetical protein
MFIWGRKFTDLSDLFCKINYTIDLANECINAEFAEKFNR